ncbi:MAG: DNA methyltransferase [Candidatus Micrarchaeota archaeon]
MYKHSYSKELVEKLLDEFGITTGTVLDPFCGGGTTLLACKEKGIGSYGFDIMPFSVFVTRVKTQSFDKTQLKEDLKTFNPTNEKGKLPEVEILDKAFTPSIKKTILGIRNWIDTLHNPQSREFYLLALLAAIDKVSRAVKSGGFLRIVNRRATKRKLLNVYYSTVEKMMSDLEQLPLNSGIISNVAVGDARALPTGPLFDAVITSPPYPNRHDYTRVYALELLISFVNTNNDLKQLRYETLRSHVEAKTKFPTGAYRPPNKLTAIIKRLQRKKLNNPQITSMLSGYFEDMYLALYEMKKTLKLNGRIALVVSNVRYAGIPVPVDQLLAEVGEQTGLVTEKILVARKRGNSAQQMKKYKRRPNRESIIIWRNLGHFPSSS